ncbi:MAG TPA: universal stress protein [Thiohalobacter sp.]|nr:universal stress protein [Thiohalobacter sp.]
MAEQIRQILVASDLSPRANRALSRGWRIAAQHDAVLSVLHIVEPVDGPGVPSAAWERLAKTPQEAVQVLRQEAQSELRRQLERNQAPGPASVDIRTRVGDPLTQILDEVRERSIELVVIGAHGRHLMRDRLLGTLAEKIVGNGACPVLVVRTKPAYRYQRVLVPVDFSDTSRKALELVHRLAPRERLLIMHADAAAPDDGSVAHNEANHHLPATAQEREHIYEQKLRRFADAAGLDPGAVDFLLCRGDADTTIVRAATDLPADLIAIGTRSARGIGHLMIGSVAMHTLREARCDVLAVPP